MQNYGLFIYHQNFDKKKYIFFVKKCFSALLTQSFAISTLQFTLTNLYFSGNSNHILRVKIYGIYLL